MVLTPASLVGQWREELSTNFDIACASTHDAPLRGDPERFWSQKRVIASIALARRAEHAQRLLARSFDLVIVDEAHHLRDRASASYSRCSKRRAGAVSQIRGYTCELAQAAGGQNERLSPVA
jgi:superfamily II DNA or RNA helicase